MSLNKYGVSTLALSVGVGLLGFGFGSGAAAQDTGSVSEVIVTGTRTTGMKAADSAAPIELVGAAALKRSGVSDLASALATSVPSLNIQTTGGDIAALSIQAALRGLNPNDTLVLVNGKRRHTTSNLAVDGGSPYSGAATTDLSFIPISAIDHIEVLQDGAAAQYGTDAIAGVVNIILKNSDHGGALVGDGGQYYNGEGVTGDWSVNKGFSLNGRGFVNVSIEERYHDFSEVGVGDRRVQGPNGTPLGTLTSPNSNVTGALSYPRENQLNGDPQFNVYNAMFNAGYDLGGGVEAYAFGSVGDREAQHYENYRVPSKVSGTPLGGSLYYPLPYGFDPREQIKELDYSITGGVKGKVAGWNWDFSTTFGKDQNDVYVVDSANAQLFPLLQGVSTTQVMPQRTFYDGTFKTTQWTTTLDADKAFDIGLASPLNVAVGVEERRETFSISAGEPSSYYGAGAQSFDGYTPLDAGTHSRSNTSAYVDLAVDPITGLHTDLAGRFEHYSDFGDTEVGKFTARYDINKAIAVRGTISNGFRAPTLAEEYYSGTNVSPTSADVQLPPNSAAAKLAGFGPLKPEQSFSYSAGFVAHPLPKLQITADLYEIQVNDRILTSGFIYGTNTIGGSIVTISQGVLNAITAKGVTLDSGLSYTGISIFANAANTRTDGAEITANYASDFGDFGHVDWSLGFNFNKTQITKLTPLPSVVANVTYGQTAILSRPALSALTTGTPREKLILQAFYTVDKWSVNLRETIYGPSSEWGGNNAYFEQIPWTPITDIDVSYKITKSLKLQVGANNVFGTVPPKVPTVCSPGCAPANGALVYRVPFLFSPYGVNGGYYYSRLTYSF